MTIASKIKKESHEKLISFPIIVLLIYLVCTYFPIIYIYMPFLGTIKLVLLSGIALVISFILFAGDYRKTKVYGNPVVFAWVGFFAVMIMSLVVSYDRGATLVAIEGDAKYFIVFLVMIKIIDSDRRLNFILMAFAACGAGMAVVTNVNYLLLGATYANSFRAVAIESGIFGDPNDLAMLFNTTLPILLFFLVTKRKKLFPVLGIIMVVPAIMYTYSRGGFLGLCIVGLGFLLLAGRKKKSYVFVALIAAVMFWTLASESYRERISTIQDETQVNEKTGKYSGRLEAWRAGLREALNRPILGAGAACSGYISGIAMKDWHAVHNSFLQVFTEMGLFGFFFFASLFILPFKQYRKLARHPIKELEVPLQRFRFILLSFTAFATGAFFLPQGYSPILSFLSGVALIQAQLISKAKESEVGVSSSSHSKKSGFRSMRNSQGS